MRRLAEDLLERAEHTIGSAVRAPIGRHTESVLFVGALRMLQLVLCADASPDPDENSAAGLSRNSPVGLSVVDAFRYTFGDASLAAAAARESSLVLVTGPNCGVKSLGWGSACCRPRWGHRVQGPQGPSTLYLYRDPVYRPVQTCGEFF
eukprot:scaffold713_cov114-Isochrysis_galbana.AAC.10